MLIAKLEWLCHQGITNKTNKPRRKEEKGKHLLNTCVPERRACCNRRWRYLSLANLDFKIKLWDYSYVGEDTGDDGRLLSTLSAHSGMQPLSYMCALGPIMVVRWSNGDGRFLASGSDDRIILIWHRNMYLNWAKFRESGSGTAFGETTSNKESWRIFKRLASHRSGTLLSLTPDVTDISWSYDNAYLASASLDCRILIWSGRSFSTVYSS